MKKKTLSMLIALVLVLTCAVGATLAWLTDKTDTVTNTFTVGDIEIDLTETVNPDGSEKKTTDPWKAQMLPGETYAKNPTVSVDGTKTNVDCYLFVKFVENEAAKKYLTYTSLLKSPDWGLVKDTTNVWYRIVKTGDDVKSWELLENNEVTVNGDTVTKDKITEAAGATLSYTAYAVQVSNGSAEFTPEQAWAQIPDEQK